MCLNLEIQREAHASEPRTERSAVSGSELGSLRDSQRTASADGVSCVNSGNDICDLQRLPFCGKDDLGAGIGIGAGIVMLQRDAQMRTNIVELIGAQPPGFARDLQRAKEWSLRNRKRRS